MNKEVHEQFAKIQQLFDEEVARNKIPVTAGDVPLSYEAITDEWLTAVLCATAPGAKVVSHQLGGIDDGTTNRRRITVNYNDAGRSAGLVDRLFCKASFGFANRFTLGPVGALAAEVDFCNGVRSYLTTEATEGIFAQINPASNSIIMTKDISHSVDAFCDHTTVMNRARAESQMRVLAALHSAGTTHPKIVANHGNSVAGMIFSTEQNCSAWTLAHREDSQRLSI